MQVLIPSNTFAADYIVQPGDTLTHIARQFGSSVEAIVQANDIADPDLIIPGQVLDIPAGILIEPPPHSMASASEEQLLVANFDTCSGINNLSGQMGKAPHGSDDNETPDVDTNDLDGQTEHTPKPPDNYLDETYITTTDGSCVVKLVYQIRDWGAFWMKLPNIDLTSYRNDLGMLTFDIRADEPAPNAVKIELKRFCPPEGVNGICGEISVYTMTGITSEWQTRSVPLEGFGSVGWASPLTSWDGIEELVFVIEVRNSGNNGTLYLDNITFER
ncbi:MAG: LysM peptidoglycan-binding domain-containing protein [Hyphomicrobiales bacterium]|nr:LysM peptidoglycan-binding domain-containing protein [Hyphomicrobiales bacterium]